jgi:hypothetical protein
MDIINCILCPIPDDNTIIKKLKVFGIFTPDDEKTMYKGNEYYIIKKSPLWEISMLSNESSEIKEHLKKQYLKICSFAYLFKIGKDCIKDKYNRLIPIDLKYKNQDSILQNNGQYSEYFLEKIVTEIYSSLDLLETHEHITRDEKWAIIHNFQERLDFDDLVLDEKVGICCWCKNKCNPKSQTCRKCPRDWAAAGYPDHFGEQFIAFDDDEELDALASDMSDASLEDDMPSLKIYIYNGEETCLLKDVIKIFKSQFKDCSSIKSAIVNKQIHPVYHVSLSNDQWVSSIPNDKTEVLVLTSWIRANIIGFFQ